MIIWVKLMRNIYISRGNCQLLCDAIVTSRWVIPERGNLLIPRIWTKLDIVCRLDFGTKLSILWKHSNRNLACIQTLKEQVRKYSPRCSLATWMAQPVTVGDDSLAQGWCLYNDAMTWSRGRDSECLAKRTTTGDAPECSFAAFLTRWYFLQELNSEEIVISHENIAE